MRIACVHPHYELYGSDRCFVESVNAIRKAHPNADIEVVLPRPGPIVEQLTACASRILFEPLWVLRRRNMRRLLTVDLFRLPMAVARAAARFRSHDVVYISTAVTPDYALAARMFEGRALLHVHELPNGVVRTVLRKLVEWSRAEIIFNSLATQTAFALPDRSVAHVIYNGIKGPGAPEPVTYDGKRKLRLLMLGRININKGQDVLLRAAAALPASLRTRLEIRIVGSAFEDPQPEHTLRASVEKLDLGDTITIEPFVPDPAPLYRWADLVVIPTVQMESLGRVAIEAMAYGRPQIATAVGGLLEVVEHERTGWVLPPGCPKALAAKIKQIIENPTGLAELAAAGRARYLAMFSEEAASAAIASVISGFQAPSRGIRLRTT
jgi:glycosyltransferase involved in cell wall biosynthesis